MQTPPEDYVFVPRMFSRWYFSPNLKDAVFVSMGKRHEFPNGWAQSVELTTDTGNLADDDLYGCNRSIVWVKGMKYLPAPRRVHELTEHPNIESLQVTSTTEEAYTPPEGRKIYDNWLQRFH